METKVYIKGSSIYDAKETREISLEKICETFGLDAKSVKFCMGKDADAAEIFVIPMPNYGLVVDGAIGNGETKDLYGLANVAFNNDNNKPGFYTQVFPGLYSAAEEYDECCCEESAPMVIVNQQKREYGDNSNKVVYYDCDIARPLAATEGDEMLANTIDELAKN